MEQLIEDSLDVLDIIDEALAANDPYNRAFPTPDDDEVSLATNASETSSTSTTSSSPLMSSEIVWHDSALDRKERRKAANRLTAKKSRERRMAYVLQLQRELLEAHEHIAKLTSELNHLKQLKILDSLHVKTAE